MKFHGKDDTAVRALDDVDIEFRRGRFTAVTGPSGSGRSTLMHCMAGLDTQTFGQVRNGDDQIAGLDDKDLTRLRRDRIGFVFQSFNLVPSLTAGENITLPASLAGRKVDRAWFENLGDRLAIRAARLDVLSAIYPE